MSRRELGDAATTVVADGSELVIERVFAAPRELVWAAMTVPQHLAHWIGPHGTTTEVVELDLRPGGRWKWINRYDGGEIAFQGEYLEVDPPKRLVRTTAPDLEPAGGPPAVETITFDEVDGGTRVLWVTVFPAPEVLDFAVDSGMITGILEQYERLADLVAQG
ncbi:SRPBCC domain-containing protein [Jiangella anatolica]|uniref:Glutathione S-transferase n=1 Tax=Jiangella anatolica TaxID=2670374 RepID=A0A2W2B031_9ACTN|nr:SRPBCC domain-containing protein [Jiangella anatolica]PZF79372.1 glutathione S-transferase [Jiangella anatolica]